MKKKKEHRKIPSDPSKKIQKWKQKRIKEIKAVLSSRVKKLKLSNELLFQLSKYGVVSADLSSVELNFYLRLERFNKSRSRIGLDKIIPSPLGYRKVLKDALNYCLQPMAELPLVMEQQDDKKSAFPAAPWFRVPDAFFAIADKISRSVDPKEVNWKSLSVKQKEGLLGAGIEKITDLFELIQDEYLTICFKQHPKYSLMYRWLMKIHPHLYEFYLHGKSRYGEHGSFFPSMAKRLKVLINSLIQDTLMLL